MGLLGGGWSCVELLESVDAIGLLGSCVDLVESVDVIGLETVGEEMAEGFLLFL
jgi:hypothetical protein